MSEPVKNESAAQVSPPWYHRYRFTIFGLGGIALLVLLLLAIGEFQRYLITKRVEKRLAAIRAQGAPTSLSELNLFYTHVPDDENAALLLVQSYSNRVTWDDIYGQYVGSLATNCVLYVTNPITPAAELALKSILSSNQTSLHYLHAASLKSKSRYPLDFLAGTDLWLPNLMGIKPSARLLFLEALQRQTEGRQPEAVESLEAALGVADSLSQEPTLISFFVRNAGLAVSIHNIELFLQRSELRASELLKLQERLALSESKTDLVRVLHGERGFVVGTWNEPMSKQLKNMLSSPATPFDQLPDRLQLICWHMYEHGGYKEQDLLNYLDLVEELEAAAKLPPDQGAVAVSQLEARLNTNAKPSMDMIGTTFMFANLSSTIKRNARVLAQLRTAQTGLAVERYRVEHQQLPKTLADLIPQYLPSVPLDPYMNAPLRYLVTSTGFRVYSLGDNQADDQGLGRNSGGNSSTDDIAFMLERFQK